MSRQFVLTVNGENHLFQETKTWENHNQELHIVGEDGKVRDTFGIDLGPVNADGCLREDRTGLFPKVGVEIEPPPIMRRVWKVVVETPQILVSVKGKTHQEAIDLWNQHN